MRRDTQEELQRLSEALLMEKEPEAPEEPEWEVAVTEEDLYIEDVPEYKNHANNYGNAFNADRTEVSAEALSDALLSPQEDEKGSGKLLLLAFLLLLAIAGVAIYWVVAH